MFWRGVLGYLPVNVISGLVGLLTIVTFTRLLTPAQFGDFALGFSVMSLAHTAIFTWNEAAMSRFWAAQHEAGDTAHHTATVYRAWLGLAALLAVVIAIVAFLPLREGLKVAVMAGLATIPPRAWVKLAQERRRAAGEVRAAGLLDMAQSLGGFVIGALLAWKGLGGASPLIGTGLAAMACLPFVLKTELALSTGGRTDRARLGQHAAYGLPVALSLILALILSTTDRFLLATFLNESAVGVYHAGYSLANRTLDVVFIWLSAAGFPALVMALETKGREGLAIAAREQANFIVLLTVPAAAGLVMVARPLAELMIGENLRVGAAHVMPWIAASGLMAGFCTHYLNHAFTVGKKTPLLMLAIAIPAGANLILNLILIPRLGLDGALWATLISYGLGLVTSAALGRGSVALPIPWLTLVQAGGAALIMMAAVAQVPDLGGWLELAAKACVGGAIYGVLALVLNIGGVRARLTTLLASRRAVTP